MSVKLKIHSFTYANADIIFLQQQNFRPLFSTLRHIRYLESNEILTFRTRIVQTCTTGEIHMATLLAQLAVLYKAMCFWT